MAEYRTIRVSFWNDPYIEDLSPVDKLLYIYLFTCPHVNNLGLVEVSQKKIAFETGLASHDIRDGLMRMAEAGKAIVDGQAIWLVNFIKHQATTSPKLIQSIKKLIPSIPSATIKHEVCLRYPHIFDDCDTVSIPSDTVSIPSRELERELEREVERIPPNPPSGGEEVGADGVEPRQRRKPKIDRPAHGDRPQSYAAFKACFALYPIKQAEEDAWTEWCRLEDNGTLAPQFEIRESIIRHRDEDAYWQKNKAPLFWKWLKGKRWNDEPVTEPSADTQEGPPPVRSYSDEQLEAMGIAQGTW